MPYTNSFLLDEIHRYIIENGKIPAAKDMGGEYPCIKSYKRYFGTWVKALCAAGFRPVRGKPVTLSPILTRYTQGYLPECKLENMR